MLRMLAIIVSACLLAACSQGAVTEETISSPATAILADTRPAPTRTPPSPTATNTSPPLTETAIPPTELPSSPTPDLPTATPTIALQEVITSQQEDIIGTWESQRGSQLIITDSGGVRIKDNAGVELVGVGSYRFEDEQLVLDSDVCLKWENGFAIEFACVATYTVYLIRSDDETIGLRFDLIEDPYRDRRNAITGREWWRTEE